MVSVSLLGAGRSRQSNDSLLYQLLLPPWFLPFTSSTSDSAKTGTALTQVPSVHLYSLTMRMLEEKQEPTGYNIQPNRECSQWHG